jgi:hypothetical protein
MIGRTRPRIRDRRSRIEIHPGWRWCGLLLGLGLCAAAVAGPPAPPPPEPPPPSQAQGAPDDDFIEFLGADDVGDAAWWEFLKKAPPRVENPPTPPPQEAKQ